MDPDKLRIYSLKDKTTAAACTRCGQRAIVCVEAMNVETGEQEPRRLACQSCLPPITDALLDTMGAPPEVRDQMEQALSALSVKPQRMLRAFRAMEDHAADCVRCRRLGNLMCEALELDAPEPVLLAIARRSACRTGAELALDLCEATVLAYGQLGFLPSLASIRRSREGLRRGGD